MKKEKFTLYFINHSSMTRTAKEVEGYVFTAITSDQKEVELFTYKLDGVWLANDYKTSTKLHNVEATTRKACIEYTKNIIASVPYEKVEQTREKVLTKMNEYKIAN